MKNRALVVLLALVFLAAGFFVVKDRLALFVLRRSLAKAFGPAHFSAKSFSVGPSSLDIREFVLKAPPEKKPLEGLALNGERLVVRFSAWGLLSRSPLAVKKADILVREASLGAFSSRNIRISADQNASGKYLDVRIGVDSAIWRDAKVKRVNGSLRVFPTSVETDLVSVEAMGGVVKLSGFADLSREPLGADLQVTADHVEMGKFMEALGMAKRVEASGLFSGNVRIVLEGRELTRLEGALTSSTGGKFLILDTSLMDKSLAQGQAANIVIENLKNYHYDIGYIAFANERQAVKASIQLEGKAGSRHLDIILHAPLSSEGVDNEQ